MWTPKRIMMLSAGFVLFTLVYILYAATSLGRINTLPPLPEQYRIGAKSEGTTLVITNRANPLQRKLEQAFRPGCPELNWLVRLELNSKSMVMAAGEFSVEKDGRVLLKPMSLALFGKKKNDGRDVEINTLKCQQALIKFDRPVTSLTPSELNGRKIVEAELFGEGQTPIVIENNRRTPGHDDDLTVTITRGPLYYIEKDHLIKTNDLVHLRDGWLTPPKADIIAKGMEMELTTTAPPPKPGALLVHKPKNESISGVKRIVLKQDVTMNLYTTGATPFPGGDKTRPAPTTAKTPSGGRKPPEMRKTQRADAPRSEPSHIIIRTPGRFRYDLFKDHDMAWFDVPEDADLPNSPQDVTVVRVNEVLGNDQLICKHLELRLKRRDSETAPAGGTATPEQGLEIETAHATGPEVTLTSDAEKLDAHGNDFFYDAGKKLTILKGVPFMEANKDESIIQAPQLQIQDIPLPTLPGSPPKTYQKVVATGPGRIHLPKKVGDKTVHTTHAFWNDKLISTRDGELDLLVLIGSARFVDEENDQSLKAETLKVWLLADDKKPPTTTKPPVATKPPTAAKTAANPQQARRPQLVHALGNVLAHSRDMNIHDTSRLIIHFTDVLADRMPPPSAGEKAGARPPDNKTAAAVPAQRPAGSALPPAQPANRAGTTGGTPVPAEPRPIDLTARSIEAEVLRCEERVALNHLWAQGNTFDNKGGVKVHQAPPAQSKERGVDIVGNTLDMKCFPEGNLLVVTGDVAQLLMDKILILGPEVNIDQAKNEAWVHGEGAMEMESNQTLEGRPLDRTVPLTIHWSERMLFQGGHAEFDGNIQAVQENARLACKHLQVFFDRPISLKEGVRGDQPAKIRNLVGDKEVRVEDQTVAQSKLQRYQMLEGSSIAMNQVAREDVPSPLPPPKNGGDKGAAKSNDANEVRLTGPGSVRILQRGGADPAAAPGKPAPNKPTPGPAADEQEMKLTYVSFQKFMRASSLTNTADFWESVRVLNLPCDDPHREIDLDAMLATELPTGAMYMRCNHLKVLSHQKPAGKSYQEMEAHGQVWVQAREFEAQSDHMTYNEAKDQIIFTGEGTNLAVLSKIPFVGAKPDVFKAKKITYIRSTGEAKADRVGSFEGN